MIKISYEVSEMIQGDDIALEALRANILNFRAYARNIQPELEKRLHKPITLGSIVTAISRLSKISGTIPPLKPIVNIHDISIKSPLVELAYDKTDTILKSLSVLHIKKQGNPHDFFTIMQGISEVTIIAPSSMKSQILTVMIDKPKAIYENLATVTVRFNKDDYIEIPNMVYSLLSAIAKKRINLIEIVSAFTDLSFIIHSKDMKETVDVFKDHFISVENKEDFH